MPDIYGEVSNRIESDWYPYRQGEEFTHRDICDYFQWKEQDTRKAVSQKLYHDYHEKKTPFLEKKGKAYRIIDRTSEEIDWQVADEKAVLDLVFPFDLQNYVKLFPKSVVVVAGEQNSGKTAFMYNFILMNMHKHIITLYNSETSPEQMKERFLAFDQGIVTPAPWRTIERYDNFADVIDPNGISVVDYVDSDSDWYQNGVEISRMFRRLKRGMALVGLQKKSNTTFKGQKVIYDWGYGGEGTLKRSSLYLAMGQNHLKIVRGKSWADPLVNPNGLEWTYKLIKGSKFVNIERLWPDEA